LTPPDTFTLLGESRSLGEVGWDDARLEKLWRYNLHYFDDLAAEDGAGRREAQRAVILRWIRDNPPGRGTGWEPYPTSRRIVNWIRWELAGQALEPAAVHSLAIQARWLARRLEYHLLGNHLLANAKALLFAGCFFAGREADSWIATAMRILARELPEQILPDGGHFELSTMYHALVLEDLLDMVNVARTFPDAVPALVRSWPEVVGRMRRWLAVMCHPDGEIAFFNDAAFGVAPPPTALNDYAARLGLPAPAGLRPVEHLEDSGYVRATAGGLVLLADVARIGPDYLPGHAHADTLSFELSVEGQRFLVNSGTSLYGIGRERLRQRGTAAHNTVVVDGADSSEIWSGFRVARRARPFELAIVEEGGGAVIRCAHDGYRRLRPPAVHRRSWTISEGAVRIEDVVEGGCGGAVARFHFDPGVAVEIGADGLTGLARAAGKGPALAWRAEAADAMLEETSFHPAFGRSLPARCLVLRLRDGRAAIEFRRTR